MSLLNEAFERYEVLSRERNPDGLGSSIDSWSVEKEITAALVRTGSSEDTKAGSQYSREVYSIITSKDTDVLPYLSVIRRIRDGKVFQIQEKSSDNQTPKSARLDMRVTSAIEWRLTDE